MMFMMPAFVSDGGDQCTAYQSYDPSVHLVHESAWALRICPSTLDGKEGGIDLILRWLPGIL